MTRRVLGMGPTGSEPGEGPTGARLLPVERLSGPPAAAGTLEGEQSPQEGVQRSGRRPLGQGSRGEWEQLLEPERRP